MPNIETHVFAEESEKKYSFEYSYLLRGDILRLARVGTINPGRYDAWALLNLPLSAVTSHFKLKRFLKIKSLLVCVIEANEIHISLKY